MPTDPERARDLYLQRTYGIDLSEYKAIVAAQGHKCPICDKPLEGISNPVDHDHVSKIIRGVLHNFCNHRVLGRLRFWETAYRMYRYLKDPPARRVVGSRQVPVKKKAKRKPRAKPVT